MTKPIIKNLTEKKLNSIYEALADGKSMSFVAKKNRMSLATLSRLVKEDLRRDVTIAPYVKKTAEKRVWARSKMYGPNTDRLTTSDLAAKATPQTEENSIGLGRLLLQYYDASVLFARAWNDYQAAVEKARDGGVQQVVLDEVFSRAANHSKHIILIHSETSVE